MIEDPISEQERREVATRCVAGMQLMMAALVDKMDDRVNLDYHGWPERLVLIGKDGKIAYPGKEGPFGFEPEELEAAIQAEVSVGEVKRAPREPKPHE